MEIEEVDKMMDNAARAIEDAINIGGVKKKPIVDKLLAMHRTLQQTFMSEIVIALVRRMAQNYDNQIYDARNKEACAVAKDMWEAVKKRYDLKDEDEIHLSCV